jgi:hypothetical protein
MTTQFEKEAADFDSEYSNKSIIINNKTSNSNNNDHTTNSDHNVTETNQNWRANILPDIAPETTTRGVPLFSLFSSLPLLSLTLSSFRSNCLFSSTPFSSCHSYCFSCASPPLFLIFSLLSSLSPLLTSLFSFSFFSI